MATKYFCDGCGKEATRALDLTLITISFGEHQNNPKRFDLCGGCLRHFEQNSLPTTWPRVKRAEAA